MSDLIWKLVVCFFLIISVNRLSRVTFLWCLANFPNLQCHCDNFACIYFCASITVPEIILAAFHWNCYSLHSRMQNIIAWSCTRYLHWVIILILCWYSGFIWLFYCCVISWYNFFLFCSLQLIAIGYTLPPISSISVFKVVFFPERFWPFFCAVSSADFIEIFQLYVAVITENI